MYRFIAAVLWMSALTAGCAVRRPAAFRVDGSMLIPPGVKSANVDRRTFAPDAPAGNGVCPGTPEIAVRKKRTKLRVTVKRDALAARPAGWLETWSAGMEASGCVPAGEGAKLATQIAESVPLEINAGFRLLHAGNIQSGRIEIGEYTRIQVVSPILQNASPAGEALRVTGGEKGLVVESSGSGLIGYETAWYGVKKRNGQPGWQIVPLYAERHIDGKTERTAAPATRYFRFGNDTGFYRLFYKAGETDYTALMLGARDGAELEKRSLQVENETGFRCMEACETIPKGAGVNPFVAVTVNGEELVVAWGSTVGDAIAKAHGNHATGLKIEIPFGRETVPVRFTEGNPAVLRMVLSGGEAISLITVFHKIPHSRTVFSAAKRFFMIA